MELNSIFHVFAVGGGRSAGLLLLCITNFAPASFAFCKESVVRSSPLHGRRAPSALAQGCFPVHQVLEQAAGDGAPLAFISGTQSEMADAVVFNTLSQNSARRQEGGNVFWKARKKLQKAELLNV
eukprot:scaffold211380_cov17-Tisochrysis_lutea.AAC.1